MKKRTSLFLDRAKCSLILGIELFNRPSDQGRVEAVLMHLDHSFEMLLKAVLFERTGRIRGAGEKVNYGFEKCVNVCQDQLEIIDADETLILKNLNGFRDAAQHDIVEMSEALFYGHTQSAVLVFGSLLARVFKQNLADVLPRRILPISTVMPADIQTVVSEDIEGARSLLGSHRRREEEASARLRPYEIMERNIRSTQGLPDRPRSMATVIKRLKGNGWQVAFPMVAGLMQSSPEGIPISIRVTKQQGVPVRIDPNAPTAIAFRYVKPEDKYPFLTSDVADKLGIGRGKVVGLITMLDLKGKDEYHISIRTGRNSDVQRYSQKTVDLLTTAIDRETLDGIWAARKAGERRTPEDYGAKPIPIRQRRRSKR